MLSCGDAVVIAAAFNPEVYGSKIAITILIHGTMIYGQIGYKIVLGKLFHRFSFAH